MPLFSYSTTNYDWKDSVRAATTGNITLSGTQTVDAVVLVANDRVLVKNQTLASENGLYLVQAGAWLRTADAASDEQVTSQMLVGVEEGTVSGSSLWRLSTPNPIVLGTTGLTFTVVVGNTGVTAAGAKGDIQLKATGANLEVESASGFGLNYSTANHSLTIGPAGTNLSNNPCSINGNIDGFIQSNVQNIAAGASASSDIVATANNGTDNVNYIDVGINSSTYADVAYTGGPDDSYILNLGGDLVLSVGSSGKGLRVTTNGSTDADEKFSITSAGNVVVGIAALATNATDGFLYAPGSAGIPSGTPTSFTGRVPLTFDTTNNTLGFYTNGAWRTLDPSNVPAVDWKDSVRIATTTALAANTRTGNILTATANGIMGAVDGVTPVVGNRILVKNEATGANNGIYTVTSIGANNAQWILTRAADADTSAKMTNGVMVYVSSGTATINQIWILTTADPIILNTTALAWTQFFSIPSGGTIGAISEVNAAGDITTTSTTDVISTNMTITPGAGTYQVIFSSDWINSANNTSMFISCYQNGTQITNSSRQYLKASANMRVGVTVSCLATVSAGQAIDIRWRVSNGTGTMGNRSLSLIKAV